MNTSSTSNSLIFTEDGKYKFCSKKVLAQHFGISYSKMRAVIDDLLPNHKQGMLTPLEVKQVDNYVNNNERPAKK